MRNTLLLYICLLCGATSLHAADDGATATARSKDDTYLQVYGGINKSANENLPWSEFSAYPWSGGAFLALGKEFNTLWGWRMALRFNHNKSRNVQKCESPDTWGWHNLGLFADATFDLTDACRSQRPGRWSVKAFAGIGAGYTFGFDKVPLSYSVPYNSNSHVVPAFRFGLTASYRVSPNWRLGAELSQTMFADMFNGVKTATAVDGRTNLKLGVTYVFAKRQRKPVAPVVYDTRLHQVPQLPFIMPQTEDLKLRQLSGRAFLDFPVNETVIHPEYRWNPQELKRIIATIDSALFDKSIQVRGITLHGYASPESPYSNNERLSKGRVESLCGYLRRHYDLPSSVFTLKNTPEDWQNLRQFIAQDHRRRVKGDVWYEGQSIMDTPEMPDFVIAHRDELLRVIDLPIDPDERELKLKHVGDGEPYKWLLQYVYPGLRHTDYVIEYVVRNYTVAEARRLIYVHPEALSMNEMYKVASSYSEGSDEWLDAMLIAARQYPDCLTSNLNAACACVITHRLDDAKMYLQKSGDNEPSRYVSDVIKALEGTAQWTIQDGKVVLK